MQHISVVYFYLFNSFLNIYLPKGRRSYFKSTKQKKDEKKV